VKDLTYESEDTISVKSKETFSLEEEKAPKLDTPKNTEMLITFKTKLVSSSKLNYI
jgi:hypothetical protein